MEIIMVLAVTVLTATVILGLAGFTLTIHVEVGTVTNPGQVTMARPGLVAKFDACATDDASAPTLAQMCQLRQILTDHFGMEDLRNLIFDLGVDPEDLPATTKAGLARELIRYLGRMGRLLELMKLVRTKRPQVSI